MSEDTATTEFSVYQIVTLSNGYRVRVETINGTDVTINTLPTVDTLGKTPRTPFRGSESDLNKVVKTTADVLDTYRTIDSEWRD